MMSLSEIFLLLSIFLLLNAFFAFSEMSLASSQKRKLSMMLEQENDLNNKNKIKLILKLIENPSQFIILIQLFFNLIAILSGVFGEQALSPIILDYLKKNIKSLENYHDILELISISSSILLITFLFILFAELIPKRIAFVNPEQKAMKIITPIYFLIKCTKFFIIVLSAISNKILSMFNIHNELPDKLTFEEVQAVLDESSVHGVIDKSEKNIIDNVLSLTDKNISLAVTLKNDIIFLDIHDSRDMIIEKILRHPHARFLVSQNEKDNVLGYISSSHILKQIINEKEKIFDLEKLKEQGLKPILILPDTISLLEVLDKFTETKQDIAIVCNEFGMLIGLITLNDVLSSLMSQTVFDSQELIVQRDTGSWLIDGQASYFDVCKLLNWNTTENQPFETLNGFLVNYIKCIPKKAQKVNIQDVEFEIVDIDGFKIDEVMVTIKKR